MRPPCGRAPTKKVLLIVVFTRKNARRAGAPGDRFVPESRPSWSVIFEVTFEVTHPGKTF
jgi:hypothetical protein